jgi:hypothetical protein
MGLSAPADALVRGIHFCEFTGLCISAFTRTHQDVYLGVQCLIHTHYAGADDFVVVPLWHHWLG